MRFSDVVHLKSGQPIPAECHVIPAHANLFGLSERAFSSLPDCIAVVDEKAEAAAIVDKELLLYLRRRCRAHRLIAMLENAPIGVVAIDDESRIFYVNRAYGQILGVAKHRVLSQYMRDIEPEAAILAVVDGRVSLVDKTVWIASVKRHVRVNITPLAREGKPWGAVSFFTDVTESTRLAGELTRAQGLADHFRQELETSAALPKGFADIVSRNPGFLKVLRTAGIVARTDVSLLIEGEHGVGKEVLARAVHAASPRRARPFITVNCAAVPDTLLESELFGYEEGTFTGAKKGGRLGKFELADGGTLFLDEIGDMPTNMQAKLLRALQDKEIEKIGRKKTVTVDVRIIAATNRDLQAMVKSGAFRADLYYRLNVVSLAIPPLRERPDDIVGLAQDILAKYNRKYGKSATISPALWSALRRHSWPGNVRELANILEYTVIMCEGPLLLPDHLPAGFQPARLPAADPVAEPVAAGDWNTVIAATERQLLSHALAEAGGNRSRAIERLGISRKQFYAKLKRHGLM